MGQYDVGLPNRTGSAVRYRVGDLRPFGSGSKLTFSDEDGTWLKTGRLLNWSGAYAGLLKNHKGMCVKDYPANQSTFFAGHMINVYKVNGQYHGVGGATSLKKAGVGNAGDLSFSNDISSGFSSGLSQMNCSMLMTGGIVVVGGNPSSSNSLYYSINNGAYSSISVSTSIGFMASNTAGTLGVAFQYGSALTGTNNIFTTANGSAFTPRNGSGGGNGTCTGLYWSPCSNAFLFTASSLMNKSTDGYTQAACTIPANFTFASDPWKLFCASSNTATILTNGGGGSAGRFMRTTDGVTFTEIFPFANDPYEASQPVVIAYDGTRFIIQVNASNSGVPTFWYSEDDGVTWFASVCYEVITDSVLSGQTINSISFATDKLIMSAQYGGTNSARIYDMTNQIGSTVQPTKVGKTKMIQTGGTSTTDSFTQYFKAA